MPVLPEAQGAAAQALARVRADIRARAAYAVAGDVGRVKLDLMENPYALPPALAQALGERLGAVALNRYPPGDTSAFKARLAERVGVPAGCPLLLGNGSDELIQLMILACAAPDAVVLAPWPSFSMYKLSAEVERCRFVGVPLRADFSLDTPAMLEAIARHQPALVFLSVPNNPTGALFDAAGIEAVLAAAPGLVVIDEAYLPFAQQTWIGRVSETGRLLVLRTVSKLGLAGVRLGYLCGPSSLLNEIDKVRPPFNVNVLTLAAVDFLLDHFALLDAQAARLRADRALVAAALARLAGVEAFPSAANFILFRVADPRRVFAGLLQRGILIKDVSASHPLLSGCLRVTIGTPDENRQFLEALSASL